jgi:hypothetical protein
VETGLDGVMAAKTIVANKQQIARWIDGLNKAVARGDMNAANVIFREAIPDYRPEGS